MNGDVIASMASKYNPKSADSNIANITINGTIGQVNGLDLDAYKVQVAVTLSLVVGVVQVVEINTFFLLMLF